MEIHGAHGFLLQNFMSPYFNKRADKWGGILENRMRFPLAIVQEIKATIKKYNPQFILGYRLSPDESMEGALRLADNLILIDNLIDLGLDYLHISLQNALFDYPVDNTNEKYIDIVERYVAKRVPLMVAGGIKTPAAVEEVLNKNYDFCALGKVLLTDPDWLKKVLAEEVSTIEEKLVIKNSDLALPQKLLEEIIKNKGWFELEI